MNGERVIFPGALCAPLAYDPSFKGLCILACFPKSKPPSPECKVCLFFLCTLVEVRLHEPLWKVQFSPDDVAIEVLTLCSQLEPLCKKEYAVSMVYILFFCGPNRKITFSSDFCSIYLPSRFVVV